MQNNSITVLPSFNWYYTGFSHSDGSLYFIVEKNQGYLGFRIAPVFAIQLTILSKEFIYDIARFFGCGRINISKDKITFKVTDFKMIWNVIIPHFLAFPFSGRKFLVFKIFIICCTLLYPFYSKNQPYWNVFKILYLSFLMNEGSKRTLNELLELLTKIQDKAIEDGQLNPESKYLSSNLLNLLYGAKQPLEVSSFPTQFEILSTDYKIITKNQMLSLPIPYILGVIEGDGSFNISFLSSPNIYRFEFSITTSIDDISILILIKLRLGCGKIETHDTWCRLTIHKMEELTNIVIPLIDSIPNYRGDNLGLLTSKLNNYNIWKSGIIKHNNKDFSYKIATTQKEALYKKTALIEFITSAYNIHDSGNKRKVTLSQFLKIHNFSPAPHLRVGVALQQSKGGNSALPYKKILIAKFKTLLWIFIKMAGLVFSISKEISIKYKKFDFLY